MKSKFSINKNDRDAIIVLLLVIIAGVVLLPFVADKKDDTTSKEKHYGASSNKYYAQPGKYDGAHPADAPCELFPFDPNTADSTTLLRLGLQPWQVRSIYKYRSRGGRFRVKEDFARLYGLTLEKYRQLEPYITISKQVMAADVIKPGRAAGLYGDRRSQTQYTKESDSRQAKNYSSYKLRPGQTVDINTADTTELKRIPGIGSYYAQRIVDLRHRRQAFSSPDELLHSIRNFPESAIPYMTASQNFSKVYINKVKQKDLSVHPLINYTQARDIIALRRTTGAFHSIKDLSNLPSFTKQQLERLAPFLVFD